MHKRISIRAKLMLVYFLMVFVATTVIGVFMVSQTENYYVNSVRENTRNVVLGGTLVSTLNSYENLAEHSEEIQSNVDAWTKSIQMDIFVVDGNFDIIAGNTANNGKNAIDLLDRNLLIEAMAGSECENEGTTGDIPVMNMAFPLGSEETIGVLYVRSDMSMVADSIDQVKITFVKAMAIALLLALLLGFLVASSFIGPIKEMIKNAERMAKGDFNRKLTSKSNDEIGQLAETLNNLRTELNENIQQMSYEKTKLETILRYMEDGLIALDLDGHIIHANPAAATILKSSTEVLEAGTYDEFVKPLKEDLDFENVLERSFAGPVAETFTNAGFSYALRYTRFKNDDGFDVGLIMIIQDITERQKLENMQMDFVANVSHELKTPLTTIKGYTETLLDGAVEDPEMAKNFLGIVDEEADRMARLVKELLQLSRLEYKQTSFEKKDMNLIPLIKGAIAKLEVSAQQKGQQINSLFNMDDEVRVMVDKDGFEQIMLNLISNAVKYTPDGGRIDVDCYKSGNKARIVVADTGIGIPEKEISRVFERFFRVDKARSRKIGGTGLGLSITKQIVEEHGGSIEVASTEGVGTKFTVNLPLAVKRGEIIED